MVYSGSLWGGGGIDMGWLAGMTNCPGDCNIDGSSVSFSNFALKDANPPTTTTTTTTTTTEKPPRRPPRPLRRQPKRPPPPPPIRALPTLTALEVTLQDVWLCAQRMTL